MRNTIDILIADDQKLMLDGLKTILDLEDDFNVVCTVNNGKEAYELALELKPDIVLMDVRMPIMNGVEATKLIKQSINNIIVIILTTFDDDDYIVDAVRFGASGYILKETDFNTLIQSIRDIYDGNFLLPSKIAEKFVNRIFDINKVSNSQIDSEYFAFTDKEEEICKLICTCYTNKEIANKLYLSNGTVKNYVSKIYSKIGVNNRTAAVLLLKKLGY